MQCVMSNSVNISFKRLHKFSIFTVALLLSGLAFLFFSCEQKEMPETPDDDLIVWDGDKIVVNFTVSGNGFGENEVLTRQAASHFGGVRGGFQETAVIPVTDNILMYATLIEEEAPVKLRATGPVNLYSKVCIVAYVILSGDTIYDSHAEYTSDGSYNLTVVSPETPISVSPGLTYKFVAFSYDRTFPITYMDPTGEILPETPIMWGETIAAITPSFPSLQITMNPLTAMVSLVVNSHPTGLLQNNINNIEVARIHASLPKLNVKSGDLFPVNTGFGWGSFTLIPGSPDIIRSSYALYPFPATGEVTTELQLDSLWINGTLYTGPETSPTTTEPFKVVYNKPLEVGKDYTLQVNLYHASGGSADRITLHQNGSTSPKLAITNDPTDPGLFFKFGGVIGIEGNFALFNNAGTDIRFNPTTTGSGSYTSFASVPSYVSTDLVKNVSVNSYHNLTNIKLGKGDPCRLIGMEVNEILGFPDDAALYAREAALKATGEGGWRLPTPMENLRFSGLPGNEDSYDDHWWDCQGTGPNISPFGDPGSLDPYKQNVEGGEFPTRDSNNSVPDGARFLPNAGHIDNAGSHDGYPSGFPSASSRSYYWSGDPGNNSFGGAFYFHFELVYPMYTMSSQGYGATVRCVRDTIPFTIEVEEWLPGVMNPGDTGEVILP